MLFHVSEDPSIRQFLPRQGATDAVPVVWAIDDERLRNYLVPRECPRVTFYASARTTAQDRALLGAHHAVMAIEEGWLERLTRCRLYLYHLPATTFRMIDDVAGYHTSSEPVSPARVEIIDDVVEALRARNVEVRTLPSLWELHDAVAASTLEFSMIRMRNAQPRVLTAEERARQAALYDDARMQGLCDAGAAEVVTRSSRSQRPPT